MVSPVPCILPTSHVGMVTKSSTQHVAPVVLLGLRLSGACGTTRSLLSMEFISTARILAIRGVNGFLDLAPRICCLSRTHLQKDVERIKKT